MSAEQTEATETEKVGTKPEPAKPEQKPPLIETIKWSEETEYIGRTVYTTKGNAVITGVGTNEGNEYYLLEHKDSGEKFCRTAKSVRFKAVDDSYRDGYDVDRSVKTASGAPSISCGDLIADSLKGLTVEELAPIAAENGLKEKWDNWGHLNPGMRRMNLGNMLRNMEVKEPGTVKILGHKVEKAADIRHKQNAKIAEEAEKKRKAAHAEKNKALSDKAAGKKKATAKEGQSAAA